MISKGAIIPMRLPQGHKTPTTAPLDECKRVSQRVHWSYVSNRRDELRVNGVDLHSLHSVHFYWPLDKYTKHLSVINNTNSTHGARAE